MMRDAQESRVSEASRPASATCARHESLMTLLRDDPDAGAAELFRCFSGDVRRSVWRLLGPDADFDDVVQQAFCRILSSWHTVREASSFPGWIRAVTANTVNDELRRRAARRRFLSTLGQPPQSGDLVGEVEHRELLSSVLHTLQRLPAEERHAFVLRHIEGKPMDRVAQLCEVSLSTVHRRLRAASCYFEEHVISELGP